MKYLLVEWPEIQYFMEHPDYKKEVYYDPEKGVWFVPESWANEMFIYKNFIDMSEDFDTTDIITF